MLKRVIFLSLVSLSMHAMSGESDHSLFSFNILEQQSKSFSGSLPNGLLVEVLKDELGWEVSVHKRNSTDNLLYPKNWHGAFPAQITAWSHRSQMFPNVRSMQIRGYHAQLVVDLSNVTSAGESNNAYFTSGKVMVSWREGG